uniref:Uncharacterized protein n=1 Tax=Phyllostachys edulis TaxID=38705 RepID=D3IVQ1_PHYED|nr:hypothetical protein [Phyllostachys edulis]
MRSYRSNNGGTTVTKGNPKLPKIHLSWKNHTAHTRSFRHAVLPATIARYYRSSRNPKHKLHSFWKNHTAHKRSFRHAVLPTTIARYYRTSRNPNFQNIFSGNYIPLCLR